VNPDSDYLLIQLSEPLIPMINMIALTITLIIVNQFNQLNQWFRHLPFVRFRILMMLLIAGSVDVY